MTGNKNEDPVERPAGRDEDAVPEDGTIPEAAAPAGDRAPHAGDEPRPDEREEPAEERAAPTIATHVGERRSFLAPLALLIAVAALLAAGYVWWQAERAAEASEQSRAGLDDSLAQTRTALENHASVLEQLARQDEQIDEALASQAREIATLGRGLRAAERALEERSGISSAARDTLLRTEIEQYLLMANRAAQLAHDPEVAMAALRVADDRLRALDDPAYTPVREQVAAEIAALEALPTVDVTGVALRLGRIGRRVDKFPLATHADRDVAAADAGPGAEPGFWSRTWSAVRGALGSLVTVRRTDEHDAPLLAPEQEYFLRENLRLQLETARLALLRGDEANYAASLRRASAWLRKYFDTGREHVVELAETFESLADLDVVPDLPDLSGSLNTLREIGGDAAPADSQDAQITL